MADKELSRDETQLMDGNQAAGWVAYRCSEVVAIYPITPASPMGEFADEWASAGKNNIWGDVPQVVEMQSEAGAAGAIHGALQAGTLATTFTASQGLLLMIPNLYKIAGELTPFVLHVAARTLATHALSIFGDHSDVMSCRQTGMALLSSSTVQEAQDLALISHAVTLKSRVPFLHFFDGFRTSHELNAAVPLSDDDIRALMDEEAITAFRRRGMSPDRPELRGTAQNPDVFFQAREACQPFYDACPAAVQDAMDALAVRTGRQYRLFEYHGHPLAERVIIIMGSGAETARETALYLESNRGERVGVVTVHLYRPFSIADFVTALPETTRAIAVLDRTKEPGAVGEPLYLDVVAALAEARAAGNVRFKGEPVVIGGRYGLSSKEFTPTMVKAVFDELSRDRPLRRFTVGINDDVNKNSLKVGEDLIINPPGTIKAIFFGLGSDGTVGANKNSLKIVHEETGQYGQGYFVYDSRKSGATTVSHLRFSSQPIHAPYLIRTAGFVACHHFPLINQMNVLEHAAPGATVLLNAPGTAEEVWASLPRSVQEQAIEKKVKLWAVDATEVAGKAGLGRRINTVMQTCFFALSNILKGDAVTQIKYAIDKTYGRRSEEVVRRNHAAVDASISHLVEIKLPAQASANHDRPPSVPAHAPDFVQRVTAMILAGRGDDLPVSAFPVDGTWPVGTSKYEKRCIATEIPQWNSELCIQCNKCAMVCPHGVIRVKPCAEAALAGAPEGFKTLNYKGEEFEGSKYSLTISPDDCTGCTLCVAVCPAKDKANPKRKALEMLPINEIADASRAAFEFALTLPEADRTKVPLQVKQVQLFEPLFEFSGACSGCGETPYIKLLTQLYGDRAVIANATGCSSIYGGNLPTTPYTTNKDGRGPAWSNSLFEDNAEYGLGLRTAYDQLDKQARTLVRTLAPQLPGQLVDGILGATGRDEASIAAQRERVKALQQALSGLNSLEARRLAEIADNLVSRSVWILGGDGWAYDIGYGGLDHVIASGLNVNILVMDTEVYSNTGGQQSKATPIGASAKFAIAGRAVAKKDLGTIAMSYGNVYVAHVAFGARDMQTVRAFLEAESYDGPSLIIAYSHCIAHGYDLANGLDQQKLAVDSGHWPLYRYDPRRLAAGEKPLVIDVAPGKAKLSQFMANETRFRVVERDDPERFKTLLKLAEAEAHHRSERLRFAADFQEKKEG